MWQVGFPRNQIKILNNVCGGVVHIINSLYFIDSHSFQQILRYRWKFKVIGKE